MAFNEVIENFTRLKYDVDRHFIGILNLVGSMVYQYDFSKNLFSYEYYEYLLVSNVL